MMRKKARCAVFVVVVFFSSGVTAGTEKYPEMSDAKGDAAIAGSVPTPEGDILSGWLHNDWSNDETGTTLVATLKVASLEMNSSVRLLMYWRVTRNLTEPRNLTVLGDWGVEVEVHQGQTSFGAIYRPPESDEETAFERKMPLVGTVAWGSPGYVNWTLPVADLGWMAGDQLNHFYASSYVSQGGLWLQTDAAGPGLFQYVIGSPINGFPLPVRPGDRIDQRGEVPEPLVDLLGLWIDVDASRLNLTSSLSAFYFGEMGRCGHWESTFNLLDPATRHRVETWRELIPNSIGRVSLHVDGAPAQGRTLLQEGEPGYLRVELERPNWLSDNRLSHLEPYARVQCTTRAGDAVLVDQIGEPLEPSRSPSIGFWAGLISLAIAAWAVPMRRRPPGEGPVRRRT